MKSGYYGDAHKDSQRHTERFLINVCCLNKVIKELKKYHSQGVIAWDGYLLFHFQKCFSALGSSQFVPTSVNEFVGMCKLKIRLLLTRVD
jgi:hypothetical protein